MVYDPASEPGFQGRMSVSIEGWDDRGRRAFRATVEVEVTAD
jgi:hypothetical protein